MVDKSTSRTTIAPHVPTIEQINAIENKPIEITPIEEYDKSDFLAYVYRHCDLEKTIIKHIEISTNSLIHQVYRDYYNRPRVHDGTLYIFVNSDDCLSKPQPINYDFLSEAKKYSKQITSITSIVVIKIKVSNGMPQYYYKTEQEKFINSNIDNKKPEYKDLIYFNSAELGEPVNHFGTQLLCIKNKGSSRGLDQIFLHIDLYRALYMKAKIDNGQLRLRDFYKNISDCFPDILVTESHESIRERHLAISEFIVQPYLINKDTEYRVIICGSRMVIKQRKDRDIGTINLPNNEKHTIKQCNITKDDKISFDSVKYEHYFLNDTTVHDHRYSVANEVKLKYRFIDTCVKLYQLLNENCAMSFDIVTYKDSKYFSIFEFSYEFGTAHMTEATIDFLLDGQIGLINKLET